MRLIIRWSVPDWRVDVSRAAAGGRNRLRCALLGHDDEVVIGKHIIALQCRACRRRSTGWQLDGHDTHVRARRSIRA